ncbi:MraY family glycosyltransferase [Streptomyces sp. NPDC001530]|uniref:MraY family glycosyltransferase n=1 Tax=Streptomyces sp. NPDC001530 TaxID=3364582 RepID=UPI00368B7E4B
MLYGIAAATAALLLTAALAALLRTFALRFGVVERMGVPRARARSRAWGRVRPVPLLGGVAVVGGTGLVAGVGDWTDVAPLGPEAGRVLVVGIGVALLGLVADLWAVPAVVRVAGVGGAAGLVVPYDELGLPGGVLAAAWIVFVVHAFASLDHADGVMGTVGVITAFALSGCAAVEVMDGLAALLSVLAAALTGFLMHGWPPARIVPGRCGALFAGFVLASAVVLVQAGRGAGDGLGAGFALTAVASADALLVLVSRWRAGRALLRSAPDHLVHRMRRLGMTRQGVMVVIGVAAFGGALVGLLIDLGWAGAGAAWWVAGGVALVVLVGGVRPVSPRGGARPVSPMGGARPISRPRRPYPFPSPGARGGATHGRSASRPPYRPERPRPQTPDGLMGAGRG